MDGFRLSRTSQIREIPREDGGINQRLDSRRMRRPVKAMLILLVLGESLHLLVNRSVNRTGSIFCKQILRASRFLLQSI